MNSVPIPKDKVSIDLPSKPTDIKRLIYTTSEIFSIIVFFIGFLVFAGWIIRIQPQEISLYSPFSMKANTAILFILLGLSLYLMQTKRVSAKNRIITKSLALIITFISLLTLLEYLFSIDIGIDQALFIDKCNSPTHGRMSPVAGVDFLLLGIALYMIDIEIRSIRPSQFIAVTAGLIALTTMIGYIYGIALMYKVSSYTVISFYASIGFVISSIGILFCRPDKGILLFFIKDSIGSMMARRLLITIPLAPLLIDIILVSGQITGLYNLKKVLMIDDMLLIFLVIAIILHTARHLNKLEDKNKQVEETIENVARFPNENPFPVMRIDHKLNVIYTNRAADQIISYLGFHSKDDRLIAEDKWRELIDTTLSSGQLTIIEKIVDDRVFSFSVMPIQERNYVNLYGFDITTRKVAENKLNFERNKIKNILDSMQDGIYIINQEYTIEYANKVVTNEFGSFNDKKCFSYLFGIKGACPWCKNNQVFQGETVRWEFTMPKTNKTYDIIDMPLINHDGSISKMQIFRDITDRKHLENNLRLYSQAIEEAMDTVHIIDLDGKIIYSNKAAEILTGYSHEESFGMNIVALLGDKPFSTDVIIPTIFSKGRWEGEILCIKKDGSYFTGWMAANCFNDINGNTIAMIGVLRDITAKKEIENAYRTSEANIRAIMNAITESLCLISTNGVILIVNDTFAKRFGKKSAEIVGATFKDLLPPDIYEKRKEYFNEVINTGKFKDYEDKRGDIYFYSCMYPIFSGDHKVIGVAVYAVDVTKNKQYEASLLNAIKEKDVLMKEIHHRVKNNLQIVSGLIGLQLDYVKDKKYKDMFSETGDRIKSIALVHDRLYHSKELADVDLKQYILSLSNDLYYALGIGKNNIALHLNMENILISVDIAIPLGLIINELFTNALKYAFPNKKTGEINISISTKDSGEVRLELFDNGVGFPKEIDFKNSKSLGLKLVNILVKQINGTIELDKTSGSRFIIKFNNLNNKTQVSNKGA